MPNRNHMTKCAVFIGWFIVIKTSQISECVILRYGWLRKNRHICLFKNCMCFRTTRCEIGFWDITKRVYGTHPHVHYCPFCPLLFIIMSLFIFGNSLIWCRGSQAVFFDKDGGWYNCNCTDIETYPCFHLWRSLVFIKLQKVTFCLLNVYLPATQV